MNNRIIKFRVWDAWQKCWRDPALYTLGTLAIWNHSDNGPIAQQYTGCNDAHNKEIYEDDIVEINNGNSIRIGYIKFMAGIFFVNYMDETDDELGYMLVSNIKVIGNLMEHRELLK